MSRKTARLAVPRLSPEKGAEVVGVLVLLVALLLAVSLASHHPGDASFLHQISGESRPLNFIGPVGAEVSAAAFGLLGLAALVVPLLLLVAGLRRLRRHETQRVVGRGLGALILLVALPGLLHLAIGDVPWRGVSIPAGGGLGAVAAVALKDFLGLTGAILLVVGGVTIGSALLIQSTLGEVLGRWNQRRRQLTDAAGLAWSRRRQRRQKDQSRRRVVAKHLDRAAAIRREATEAAGGPAPAVDLPLRVTEKPGAGSFSVRKVRPGTVAPAERRAAGPAPKPPPAPQSKIPFAEPEDSAASGSLPPVNLLRLEPIVASIEENELVRLGERIRSRCAEFGVEGSIAGISPGPVITVYEFQPAPGVKVSQIVNLQDDLALALKAESVRIDRLAGRSTLGIEVPNKERAMIRLGHLLDQEAFRASPSALSVVLGTTIHGEPYYADLATMPHLLVAGATGSGKSVGLQSMITSIIYKATREQVQFIFIDPKRIELGVYADIPHLKAEVVVEPKKAANALRWAVAEMERRYKLLAEAHVRSIKFYNRAIGDPEVQRRLALSDAEAEVRSEDLKPLPYYVVVIDELADLMMVATSEVEASIARLAQMARAVGIHLIVATQRPSVDVLTGTIKANFPCRISYATATRHDSRTILDQIGSEKLLGRGDMLYMAPGTSRVMRLHGAFVSEQETAALVRWLKKQGRPELDPAVLAPPPEEDRSRSGGADNDDALYDEAARLVVAERQASASFLQRRLRVGFSRAARLIDIMERDGLLGPPQGSKPRQVLVKQDYFTEIDQAHEGL